MSFMDTDKNDSLQKIISDIEDRAKVVLKDSNDPMILFKDLKSNLITSYMKNDFRISVLKKYASQLIAIIVLSEDL